jgi:aspartyl-tRNA(Asn)/glutamyl-tRNA(Gln) amidotransferase subunit A
MIYIDDSIMQEGKPATAGSKILENFIAPFDAEAVTRLNCETKRVKLSEFGLGDPGELPEDAPLLCNDVFGHVRRRAAAQGLCYIRPTYGAVSRYGLIQTAASMDQIGVVCKTPAEGFALLDKIAVGRANAPGSVTPHPPAADAARRGQAPLPYADIYEQVLTILACAEISANISRCDGVKFGRRAEGCGNPDELYKKTRTEGFGREAKLAAIIGCMVLSSDHYTRYYEKALKIRRLMKESVRFDEV